MKTFRCRRAVRRAAPLARASLSPTRHRRACNPPNRRRPGFPLPPPRWTSTGQEVVVQQAAPAGQWVFTSQYGWIWMPHGNSFTHLPSTGGTPNMFVFYPAVGWTWVIAPWVWGWGAMPWFGWAGWGGYPWFGWGFGTWYGFARPYAYAGWCGGGYYHGGRWNGVGPGYRPPPGGRGGAPPRPPAPAPRLLAHGRAGRSPGRPGERYRRARRPGRERPGPQRRGARHGPGADLWLDGTGDRWPAGLVRRRTRNRPAVPGVHRRWIGLRGPRPRGDGDARRLRRRRVLRWGPASVRRWWVLRRRRRRSGGFGGGGGVAVAATGAVAAGERRPRP